jgi:outer membrane protein assembly factor BamD
MRYLVNAMATYEVNVANYYYRRGAFVASANRAQGALVNYPQTPANERALDILRNSYQNLNLAQLSADTEKILVKTFPESRFVTGESERPWWNFWSRDRGFGVQSTGQMADRPWWKFWD